MNNLQLQPLKWFETEHSVGLAPNIGAQGAGIFYRIAKVGDKAAVTWHDQSEGSTGAKELGSVCEAKHWIETDHYPSKMRPYVKPMPTKVYELTYDCGDSYSTLFMTLDKQQAVDFMESVKDADLDFIASYGVDCAADELLIEQYEDNHPLAPYKDKILNSIYEDSFSEWMLNYGGNSFASSLGIIEHELFSTMQNLHKGGDCE